MNSTNKENVKPLDVFPSKCPFFSHLNLSAKHFMTVIVCESKLALFAIKNIMYIKIE